MIPRYFCLSRFNFYGCDCDSLLRDVYVFGFTVTGYLFKFRPLNLALFGKKLQNPLEIILKHGNGSDSTLFGPKNNCRTARERQR